jgi:hypothetical protein
VAVVAVEMVDVVIVATAVIFVAAVLECVAARLGLVTGLRLMPLPCHVARRGDRNPERDLRLSESCDDECARIYPGAYSVGVVMRNFWLQPGYGSWASRNADPMASLGLTVGFKFPSGQSICSVGSSQRMQRSPWGW